jgi:hypothetical protein
MKPVTDPAVLAQLNGSRQEVTDPAILAKLNGPEPSFAQRMGDNARGAISAFSQGINDLPNSVVELGARGLDATGLTDNAYPTTKKFLDKASRAIHPSAFNGTAGATAGRIAGQVMATATLSALKVAQGASLLPRIANGAVQGAAAGGLTSSSSDAPLGQQIALGAVGGAVLPAFGAAAKVGRKTVPAVLGNVTTGAGANSVSEAFRAGQVGGDMGAAFKGAMRGEIPMAKVVEQAKGALAKMRAVRGEAYRSGMADLSKDATVLDFAPIDEAVSKTNGVKNFKGVDIAPKTAGVRQEITDAIDHWKSLDPAEYHTPEGMDALKQKIGDIRDSLKPHSPEETVANSAYNAVRDAIVKQAPEYARIMRGYSEASDTINALQKELSLNPKANPNTALRKLQSVMRDNVNTSWGDRAKYAGMLQDNGAKTLLPQLAGQALSSPLPRGLAKYGDATAAILATLLHQPAALMSLPLASPRAVGEIAYGLGRASGGVNGLMGSAKVSPVINRAAKGVAPALGVLAPRFLAPGL